MTLCTANLLLWAYPCGKNSPEQFFISCYRTVQIISRPTRYLSGILLWLAVSQLDNCTTRPSVPPPRLLTYCSATPGSWFI